MKYSISDTTLTALGDAVRTLTNKWEYEDETPTISSYNGDINGSFGSVVYERQVDVIRFPGAKRVRVVARGNCQAPGPSNYVGYIWVASGEHAQVSTADDIVYLANYKWEPVEYVFENTDTITIGTNKNTSNPSVDLGYYAECYGTYDYRFTPVEMAEEIEEVAAATDTIPASALTITGSCQYRFAFGGWNWFINQMGDKITTENISNTNNMFFLSNLEDIPFTFNMNSSSSFHDMAKMFYGCHFSEAPMIYQARPEKLENLFQSCVYLTTFPEGFAEDWDWTYLDSLTSGYSGNISKMFESCKRLRVIPQVLLSHGNPYWNYSYTATYSGFNQCYSLEKIENVFIPTKGTFSSSYGNAFNSAVNNCYRLKKLTLMTQEDGTPYTVKWKYQVIDLTKNTGWSTTDYNGLDKATDFTTDTLIDSEEKWRGYIDGSYPDGWANDVAYSVFGATAAKELIASLPDTSAYLGTSTTEINTVKLKQTAASAIPGEEITSLTEEDIAVATAKGWTVTLS